MEKEYGKRTAEQFRDFIGKLPELRQKRDEFGRLLSDLSKDLFDSLMVSGFSWGEIYEYSFADHVSVTLGKEKGPGA